MTMSAIRNRFLIAYDIRESRRLQRVHKAMIAVGDALQYSVFLCDLSPEELHIVQERLDGLIDAEEDSVLIADLGPLDHRGEIKRGLRFLGVAPLIRGREALVI